jgi:hypothetical protein
METPVPESAGRGGSKFQVRVPPNNGSQSDAAQAPRA